MTAQQRCSGGGVDLDLVRAQGLALAMVGALLERSGVTPRGEFSQHLAMLAVITSETSAAQGEILGLWAAMTRDMGGSD
jgi:hypothetical protein